MGAESRLRIRLQFDADSRLGPGKADLLQKIRDTGSISAAGRDMKMSYTRAWALVEQMNTIFSEPVVTSARGGAKGGGATLTATGEAVLRHYRALESVAAKAAHVEIASLEALCKERDDG